MATYKAAGKCNTVRLGQTYKNHQNGRVGVIVARGKGGKTWIINIGKKSHHINEGTLLKFFVKINI